MANTVHKDLTGADLHEPKGADTALDGQIYVSDGAGSGTWTAASSVITNTAWSTGDAKLTWKTTADTGWVMVNDGTIGDGSSGASARANADVADLYTLLWTNMSDTWAPVVGGRGASAAADFAAHKKMSLPKLLGRHLVVAGSGSSLTTRTLGSFFGAETVTLVTSNLPSYTPTGSIAITSLVQNTRGFATTGTSEASSVSQGNNAGAILSNGVPFISATATFTGTNNGGTSTPFSIVNPGAAWNIMVKL